MVSTVRTVQKAVIVRRWLDIEPKVYAAFSSGLIAALVLLALYFAGFHITSLELVGVPYLASVLAAYVKASTHKGGLVQELVQEGPQQAEQLLSIAKGVPGVVGTAAASVADGVAEVEHLLAAPDPVAEVTKLIETPPVTTGTVSVAS